MAWTAIVKIDDYAILKKYEDTPDQARFGANFGHAGITSHIAIPGELDEECVKAQDDGEDGIEIVEDTDLTTAKVQTGRNAQLALMRDQRVPLLSSMDRMVTETTLSYASIPSVADIKTYREALRDVTDSYRTSSDSETADFFKGTSDLDAFAVDLSDFTWPTVPTP